MSLAAVLYEKNYNAENNVSPNGRRHSRAVGGNVPRKLSNSALDDSYTSLSSGNECSLAEHLKLTW